MRDDDSSSDTKRIEEGLGRFNVVTSVPKHVVYSWVLELLAEGFEAFIDLVQEDDELVKKIIRAGKRLESQR